jgi:hypothetical protein
MATHHGTEQRLKMYGSAHSNVACGSDPRETASNTDFPKVSGIEQNKDSCRSTVMGTRGVQFP